jgi:hypothetical protein
MFIKAVPFSPISIPGCCLWLDANDSSTLTNTGGEVTNWLDKSAFNRNAITNTNTMSKPTISLEGKAVRFGVNQSLKINNFQTSTAWTLIAIINGEEIGSRNIVTSPNITFLSLGNRRNLKILPLVLDSAENEDTSDINEDLNLNLHITRATDTNGSGNYSLFFNNDIITKSNTVSKTIQEESIVLGIGGNVDGTATSGIYNILEIIMYNWAITKEVKQSLDRYFSMKWNLEIYNDKIFPPHPGNFFKLPYSSAYRPDFIPNCKLWLDATDNSTIDVGNLPFTNLTPIKLWKDKIAGKIFLLKGDNPTQVRISNINHRQSLEFNNFADEFNYNYLSGTMTSFNTGCAFLVFKVIQPPEYVQLSLGFKPIFAWNYEGEKKLPALGFKDFNEKTFGPMTNDLSGGGKDIELSIDSNIIYFYSWNEETVIGVQKTITQISINGGELQAGEQNLLLNESSDEFWIGAGGYRAEKKTPFSLGEILMYDRVLTNTERKQNESYLANKWGLRSSLPLNHPHFTLPAGAPSFLTTTQDNFDKITNPNASVTLIPPPPTTNRPPPPYNEATSSSFTFPPIPRFNPLSLLSLPSIISGVKARYYDLGFLNDEPDFISYGNEPNITWGPFIGSESLTDLAERTITDVGEYTRVLFEYTALFYAETNGELYISATFDRAGVKSIIKGVGNNSDIDFGDTISNIYVLDKGLYQMKLITYNILSNYNEDGSEREEGTTFTHTFEWKFATPSDITSPEFSSSFESPNFIHQ